MQTIRITQTNGNGRNGIRGSRLSVWVGETLIGRLTIPHASAKYYLAQRKTSKGYYTQRYADLLAEAERVAKVGVRS